MKNSGPLLLIIKCTKVLQTVFNHNEEKVSFLALYVFSILTKKIFINFLLLNMPMSQATTLFFKQRNDLWYKIF